VWKREVRERRERAEAREVEKLILGPWVAFSKLRKVSFFPKREETGDVPRSDVIRKEASLHGSERQIIPAKICTKLRGRRVVELCGALVVVETSAMRVLSCACPRLSL